MATENSRLRVLHLEDSATDLEIIERQLRLEWPDCELTHVASRESFAAALKEREFDVILSDFSMGGFDGMSALAIARSLRPEIPFIFLSGTIGEDRAVEAMQNGASDYVIKDRPKRLAHAIRRAIGNARDVRARKSMEEQLLRVQRLENIGMLAAGIAHDFNNVLAPVMMGAHLLRERLREPMDLRILDSMERSAERGAGLVKEILGFATGVTGEPHLVQPKHLIFELLGVMRQTFPVSIKIVDQIEPALWPLKINPTHLHQVLLNLSLNARDAMPVGGTLRLRVCNHRMDAPRDAADPGIKPGKYLLFEVEDSGQGISPDIVERIWAPFFTTKGKGRGTGLGLSTVRSLVDNYEGLINLSTEVGRGTTFQVYLPATPGASMDGTPSDAPVPRGDDELILIADDNEAVRDVASAILTRYGYKVIVAANGAEALALYAPRSLEIRAVITDISMPDLDGFALIKVLRYLNPSIRILAISGLAEETERFRQLINSPLLMKPFNGDSLMTSLHALLLQDHVDRPGQSG